MSDVLQTEIWSKQTSRRIWKVFGIGFATLVVIGSAVWFIEIEWMTRQERSAAKLALADIEALQQSSNKTPQQYKQAKDRAEIAVSRAQDATRTLRDNNISNALSFYLFAMDSEHFEPIAHAKLEEYYRLHPERRRSVSQEELAQERAVQLTLQQLKGHYRDALHRSLD